MTQQDMYLPFLEREEEEEAALAAASEEAGNFREYLERKLDDKPLDAIWAFAIFLKWSPSFLEDNPHVTEDLKAILAKKGSLRRKVENAADN